MIDSRALFVPRNRFQSRVRFLIQIHMRASKLYKQPENIAQSSMKQIDSPHLHRLFNMNLLQIHESLVSYSFPSDPFCIGFVIHNSASVSLQFSFFIFLVNDLYCENCSFDLKQNVDSAKKLRCSRRIVDSACWINKTEGIWEGNYEGQTASYIPLDGPMCVSASSYSGWATSRHLQQLLKPLY